MRAAPAMGRDWPGFIAPMSTFMIRTRLRAMTVR